jgi:triacylglycerol lipase
VPSAELALAIAAQKWPSGTIIQLPTEGNEAEAVRAAVDRLRWLFAGQLPVQLINLNPLLVNVSAWTEPAEDRAMAQCIAPSPERMPAPAPTEPDEPGGSPRPSRRPARGGLLTRYPLVFCHGMLANSLLRMQQSVHSNYFQVLGEFLRQRGYHALFPYVSPTGGVAARAEQLRDLIRNWTDEPVNIIAHSMGGLDARAMISHLGMADHVRSLTTVAAPHRGSYLADWFEANYRRRVPLLLALEALGINVDGFRDCKVAVCREFNDRTPDAPEVRYFSYGGVVPHSKVSPILRRGWTLLQGMEGPNDGLVSLASSRWGDFLGVVHADHFAQTPDGVFVRPGETFDSLGFFSRIIEDLARHGF